MEKELIIDIVKDDHKDNVHDHDDTTDNHQSGHNIRIKNKTLEIMLFGSDESLSKPTKASPKIGSEAKQPEVLKL